MERIYITLAMDLTETAPQGPGWYIHAGTDQQRMVEPVLVDTDAALRLAGDYLNALQSADGELPQVTPVQLVQSGNQLIHAALENALRYAEAQAAKVAVLRKRLALVPPSSAKLKQ